MNLNSKIELDKNGNLEIGQFYTNSFSLIDIIGLDTFVLISINIITSYFSFSNKNLITSLTLNISY